MEGCEDRRVLLFDAIDNESAKEVIDKILEINNEDKENELRYRDFEREPIRMYINSYGGSVYDGLAIINTMRASKTPIDTYCIGSAMSMAFIIYLMGSTRYANEFSTLMYHQVSDVAFGKLKGIKETIKETERLQRIIEKIFISATLVEQKEIDKHNLEKTEWYIGVDEGILKGMVDKVF